MAAQGAVPGGPWAKALRKLLQEEEGSGELAEKYRPGARVLRCRLVAPQASEHERGSGDGTHDAVGVPDLASAV